MEKKCCICGMEFNGFGNNPEPIMSGCCCDDCNRKFVVPVRFWNSLKKPIDYFEIAKGNLESLEEKFKQKNFEKTIWTPFVYIYQNMETEEIIGVCEL